MKTLIDVLPPEFQLEYDDTRAWLFRSVEVVREVKAEPWPGTHKNVSVWWVLADGHIVGWNENPNRGWSFPVLFQPNLVNSKSGAGYSDASVVEAEA